MGSRSEHGARTLYRWFGCLEMKSIADHRDSGEYEGMRGGGRNSLRSENERIFKIRINIFITVQRIE